MACTTEVKEIVKYNVQHDALSVEVEVNTPFRVIRVRNHVRNFAKTLQEDLSFRRGAGHEIAFSITIVIEYLTHTFEMFREFSTSKFSRVKGDLTLHFRVLNFRNFRHGHSGGITCR